MFHSVCTYTTVHDLKITVLNFAFTYQFKFLLLSALQFFNVLRKVWPVKLVVQPLLDLQHFFGDTTKGLCYLMDQLPVVVEVIMGPRPQVGLVSPRRQKTTHR